MKRYEKKEIKWLINKPGGLFLTRRSERRFAEQWGTIISGQFLMRKILPKK